MAVFEPMTPAFVVNFNANGRQRYMQVSITMLGRNAADMEALKAHMPLIRNNLVMLRWPRRSARKCCVRKRRRAFRKWHRKNSARL
ncbi:flagellar basal body-associated protein FliL [Pseudomonas syringae pv. actinidiae ICMP 19070]|nr:flagellar basal body-associated protein FliL [Pseudomonas syringae pv. actinidiae ICMP 19070]